MLPYSNNNKKLQQAAALKYSQEGPEKAPVVIASGLGPSPGK